MCTALNQVKQQKASLIDSAIQLKAQSFKVRFVLIDTKFS